MKEISLTNSPLKAIVDDDDYEKALAYGKWHLTTRGYVGSNSRPHILLHWLILGRPPKGKQTDHRFGNKLDNRKSELRYATRSQNHQNNFRINKHGVKGVSWHKASQRWRAQIRLPSKRLHLGTFVDKNMAVAIYDAAALKYHGEFARINGV